MKSVSIHIKGKVHKTGYRFFVKQMARLLNIGGNVQYLDDNSILINAIGNPPEITKFIDYCRIGNYSSWVQKVEIKNLTQIKAQSFIIINESDYNSTQF